MNNKKTITSLLILVLLVLASPAGSAAQPTLRILNWDHYIDPTLLKDFESQYGVGIDYSTFDTAAELESALASRTHYDLVMPSDFQLRRLIQKGALQQVAFEKLKNSSHIDGQLMASLSALSNANKYVVPYTWGTFGLVINQGRTDQLLGGATPNSWALIFDEHYVDRLASCGIVMADAQNEVMSVRFNYMGRRLGSASPRSITTEVNKVLKPGVRMGDKNVELAIKAMQKGTSCVVMTWDGFAREANNAPQIRYSIPDEGSILFIDSMAIPSNADSPELALKFIDFMLEPGNALRNQATTKFMPALKEATLRSAGWSQSAPISKDDRRRLYFLDQLSDEQSTALRDAWIKLQGL
ncbi:extracellular solute-binding protein [Pseudomonas sp. JM0905a]|uniref:extracellular solute-binding protein n=1 Tax=Pseudomonas sp. JM0905a TaxID=2772484 RepID=UPI001686A822|nr:extracellular solute-binding protein [Pseudomonas sp. JM0905a]MBD2835566.1 extracellular solute-binding protein [Pseudomonas sp. JM0905a]